MLLLSAENELAAQIVKFPGRARPVEDRTGVADEHRVFATFRFDVFQEDIHTMRSHWARGRRGSGRLVGSHGGGGGGEPLLIAERVAAEARCRLQGIDPHIAISAAAGG